MSLLSSATSTPLPKAFSMSGQPPITSPLLSEAFPMSGQPPVTFQLPLIASAPSGQPPAASKMSGQTSIMLGQHPRTSLSPPVTFPSHPSAHGSLSGYGKKLGLTHFVNPKDTGEKSVVEIIKDMTDGGADYCFECIGLASLMSDAFNCSRAGVGKTIILGLEMHGNPISIDSAEILKGRCIMGSLFGGIKPKTDIPILAKQYLNKELHLDEFITHEVNFKDINKAFDLLIQGKSLRCMIWMDQ